MSRCVDNLKRSVAVGAVLLCVSIHVQQAGFYCNLGACGVQQPVGATDETASCYCHACHQQPLAPCEEDGDPQPEPCPCPGTCWCHGSPQISVLPERLRDPMQLAFHGVFAMVDDASVAAVAELQATQFRSSPPAKIAESARCRCAQLCRFLI